MPKHIRCIELERSRQGDRRRPHRVVPGCCCRSEQSNNDIPLGLQDHHGRVEAVIFLARRFPQLTRLNVGGCSLVTGAAIEAIANCNKLRGLIAFQCNISHLPEDIGVKLPHLKGLGLNLSNNKIRVIPASIGLLDLEFFAIEGNPVQQPPLYILQGTAAKQLAAVREYYKERGVDYSTLAAKLQALSLSSSPPTKEV